MFMTIEVHHTVTEGMEEEALQVLKQLYSRGLDYPGENATNRGLLIDDAIHGLDVADGYHNHLDKVFSQVRQVAGEQARIKVRLTS
ncbi:hypothetical protein ACFLU3_00285 [Chloroflexota bacterium]